ncbi:hypothetical protein NLJ89_g5522 [Agrocybe chaxingu]|uniref:Cytochrome P450 n=1 Tax=Agrocybe chaxingu TaxID=84603 RepID=A0A9W8K0E9_9AGAR|nr:hypothetical protein NLJ89_g5522 [Agrocybe chaxingu]
MKLKEIPMYFEPIDGLVNILKSQIKPGEGKQIQVYDWLSKVTLDIICETAFGYRADSLHNPRNELAEAYEQLLSLQSGPNLAKFILLVSLPGAPRFLASDWAYNHRKWISKIPVFGKPSAIWTVSQLIDAMYRIRKISTRMLEAKMRDSDLVLNDSDAKRDIMSILVRARKAELDGGKGEYAMSDRAMMDQVLTFLGAGHETTASGLTWTLWHLSNNLDVQQRLRDELRPVFSENARPDYRTLKDLQWLDCVVMESLRVMPPVPLTVRVAAKTDYIDGVLVPKGTLITIPIRVVNTWKEVWGEDAESFNPARWLSLPKDYHPTFSMLSFIAGPHACIGKTMAIIEMKAVLATDAISTLVSSAWVYSALIVNFEFEPAFTGQVPKPAAAITISECPHASNYHCTARSWPLTKLLLVFSIYSITNVPPRLDKWCAAPVVIDASRTDRWDASSRSKSVNTFESDAHSQGTVVNEHIGKIWLPFILYPPSLRVFWYSVVEMPIGNIYHSIATPTPELQTYQPPVKWLMKTYGTE